jgi:hypothetical protein
VLKVAATAGAKAIRPNAESEERARPISPLAPYRTIDFIRFWRRCRVDRPPFVHPDDEPILREHGRGVLDERTHTFESYIRSERFGATKDRWLHLGLLPVPFVGDIRRADVVILLLNPGFGITDYFSEYQHPEFRERHVASLWQRPAQNGYPLHFLDPEMCWHGGSTWWMRKLGEVVAALASKRFNGSYLKALRETARRVAAVELFPYHSSNFAEWRLLDRLPSVSMARRFAADVLLADAQVGDRLIIVTRQAERWLPRKRSRSLGRNVLVIGKNHARGIPLGPRFAAGAAILRRLATGA